MKLFFVVLGITTFLMLGVAADVASTPFEYPTGYFVATDKAYPVTVVMDSSTVFYTASIAKVISTGTGCLVDTLPCPKGSAAQLKCSYPVDPTYNNCTVYFKGGSVVSLRPIANLGQVFAGFADFYKWEGTGASTTNITVTGPRTIPAYFDVKTVGGIINTYTVSVVPTSFQEGGPGAGDPHGAKIVSSPAGIECFIDNDGSPTGICDYDFTIGTSVRLSAATIANRKFLWWWSDIYGCDNSATCTVPVIYWYFGP